MNRFFYKSGWGDGLPLVPPTEEAVQEMLTGTDLPPDHIVGKVQPRLGKATVEKIAINAVMAGALPTYLPVLIAGVEHFLDPQSRFGTFSMSTGSWSPFWIINGPVRNDIHVNCSSGAMSPGNIANAAIGRAMGLIVKNLGGIRKGVEDMGVIGNPGKYSMVVGENEEKSPWEPLHVDQGFDPTDSTISLIFPNSFNQTWPYASDDRGILASIVYNIKVVAGLGCLLLPPGHAKTLAEKGWTKDAVRRYVVEYARNPAFRHHSYYDTNNFLEGASPRPLSAMDSIASIADPDHLRIVVTGGPGTFMGLIFGAAFPGARWVTKKIALPANWKKLVAKYRNLVPTYEKY